MRFRQSFLLFAGLFYAHCSFGQIKEEWTQSRILILLDESSSMINTWPSGKPKYRAADELILSLMDSVYALNNQVEFSLRVFGHQYTTMEHNCFDTKNEVAFGKDNRIQMDLRLTDIHPLGVTPIAYALSQAAENDLIDINKISKIVFS
jgi:Ca-activated chloride channel family protein